MPVEFHFRCRTTLIGTEQNRHHFMPFREGGSGGEEKLSTICTFSFLCFNCFIFERLERKKRSVDVYFVMLL